MEYSGVGEEIDAEGKKEEKMAQVPVGFILGTGWVIVVFSEIRGTGDVGLKVRCLHIPLARQGWISNSGDRAGLKKSVSHHQGDSN